MINNILFFPSHEPTQYKEIADVVKRKSPDSSIQFFLLDKPKKNFAYDYVTYEKLVDLCDLNIDEIEKLNTSFGCNLNDLVLMDRVHKRDIDVRVAIAKYLFALREHLTQHSITHVFGYALSDSITYGCYHLCQELGIKYYFINVARLSTFYHLSSHKDGRGEASSIQSFSNSQISDLILNMTTKKITPKYASDPNMTPGKSISKVISSTLNLILTRAQVRNKYLDHEQPFKRALKRFINRKFSFRELLKYEMNYEAFQGKKFIFYPLHLHPETSTLIWGRWINNQYEILRALSRVLPNDVSLLVKEHKVAAGRHSLNYYKKISQLPNTFLINHNQSAHDLILDSVAVATISGTAGFEAICHQKSLLMFGDVDYKCLPNVIHCYDFSKIRENVNSAINLKTKNIFEDENLYNFLRLKLNGSLSMEGYTATSTGKELINDMATLYLEKL